MNKNEITRGGVYLAKVSNRLVQVRIERTSPHGGWDATNLTTGKAVRIRTAGRLQPVASEAPAPEAALRESSADNTGPRRRGTRHQILGHSACAVLKALGQAGVKYPEADAILKRHGIEMPKSSVSVQLGFGRNEKAWERHGKPAPLTGDQIELLRRNEPPFSATGSTQ